MEVDISCHGSHMRGPPVLDWPWWEKTVRSGELSACAGIFAALGQALIPFLTGQIIDYASIDPDRHRFKTTTVKLVGASFACAVVTGIRGGLFTIAMTRLNVRIRTALFSSLLRQEIGFYDTSKTGTVHFNYLHPCERRAEAGSNAH